MNRTRPPITSARAFTIVEMLVVISIIAILLTIGLLAGINFRRDARVRQFKAALDACRSAVDEYKVATALVVNHSAFEVLNSSGTDVKPFNWKQMADEDPDNALDPLDERHELSDEPDDPVAATHVYIERFVWAANKVPSVHELLNTHGLLADTDGDGFPELVDPSGRPLAYATFCSHHDEIRHDDYLPENNQPFFASAGLDGKWGLAKTAEEFGSDENAYGAYLQTPEAEQAKDNIYSFTTD